jgi:hypothetical protein
MGTKIQGNVASWADLTMEVSGPDITTIQVVDFTALTWKRTVERKLVRAQGGQFRGKTTGQPGFEVSFSLLENGSATLKKALAQVDPENISLVEFNITALWTPPKSRRIRKVEIFDCGLTEDGIASALGPDETIEECKVDCLDIVDYPDSKGPGTRLLAGTANR